MADALFRRLKDLTEGDRTIKVGVITTQEGPLDYYGTMQVRGLELGIEYATGGSWQVAGRTVELIIEDDAGDVTTAARKARELIEGQDVDILQGCVSSAATILVAGVAEEYGRVLLVEPAAADSITGENFNRYVFRTAASVWQDAAAGGRYAVENLGKTFCYIAPDYAFGRQSTAAWKKVIEQHGGESLLDVFVPPDTTDFLPYLKQILDSGADVVVQSWAGAGYRELFEQMRDAGVFDRMKVTGGLGDREARHALGLDAVGMLGICKYSHILPHNPINDWLREKHIERHGEAPDLFTGGGFAAGIALIEALKRAGGNPDAEALIPIMEGMSFEGPKGTYTFRREDHQALQPMYIVEMVPDPDPEHPWAIPQLIEEVAPEATAPPLAEAVVEAKEYVIETNRLRREFGALVAVANVSIKVRPNTIHSIIGPNGAGKTTFFNLLSGNLEPTSGRVHYKDRDITRLPLHRTAHLGIGRSFQITNIFPNLTVLENIRLACQALGRDNFRLLRHYKGFQSYEQRAWEVIRQVGLEKEALSLARTLPHGGQRKLELGIILAPDPDVLLLDEPTAGMAAEQVPELIELIQEIQEAGNKTVLLVEHNMNVVMSISDYITVMHQGQVLAEGTPADIAANEVVQSAYLGGLYGELEVN
ncbi:MAG: ABC transporter substrate-binding protein [Anaerolineales bacterium]|jgi:ABC-type branched-subunit amino acid transport system ATPase component/ABC-type branched-subunit amino acid transport system substrate-binding protein